MQTWLDKLSTSRYAPPLLMLGLSLILIRVGVFGPGGHGDIDLYYSYAAGFWAGDPPFAQLPLEYPPLALLAFTLTLLPPTDWYPLVFGLWMTALLATALLAFDRLISRRAAALLLTYLALGAVGTLLSRYDLIPALATVAALVAMRRGRFTLAYLLLAAGVLLKLYPIVLLPVIAIEHRRALGQEEVGLLPRPVRIGLARFGFAVACGFLAAAALAGAGALAPFRYALERPVQVESVPASILLLLSPLGYPVTPDHSFGSFNVLGALAGLVSACAGLALVGGCLLVYWRQARGQLPAGRAFLACVAVVLVTGKVFSPQYVVWVLALAAALEDFDAWWLALAASTSLVYPLAYALGGVDGPPAVSYSLPFIGLVLLRNLVLVVVAWRTLQPHPVAAPADVPAAVYR